ncbi:hypothetical protein HNY73_022505 [Argiope bruennichi]|uniref:Uncharacterized protein n=1 Tax=Argiope bruennichi TaxID=94029 RepID=A0A8T0E5C5_ARGBR|nr:hypothetical protein HNY73_022505 [Argiope bruennichi]
MERGGSDLKASRRQQQGPPEEGYLLKTSRAARNFGRPPHRRGNRQMRFVGREKLPAAPDFGVFGPFREKGRRKCFRQDAVNCQNETTLKQVKLKEIHPPLEAGRWRRGKALQGIHKQGQVEARTLGISLLLRTRPYPGKTVIRRSVAAADALEYSSGNESLE